MVFMHPHCFPCFNIDISGFFAMKTARALLLVSPFLLGACGEGFELVQTDTMFPYGNQRTAGSGHAYVLAKMLPKKEMKLQPVAARPAPQPLQETKDIIEDIPAPVEPQPQKAEEIFREQQEK